MNIYREVLIDHYQNPRNYGNLIDPDVIIKEENISCGDRIDLTIKVKDSKIEDIGFEGEGCAIAIASASILTEYARGKTLEELYKLEYEEFEKLLGVNLTISRIKCANLSLISLKKAIEKFDQKNNK